VHSAARCLIKRSNSCSRPQLLPWAEPGSLLPVCLPPCPLAGLQVECAVRPPGVPGCAFVSFKSVRWVVHP
jgi:hypothetical protein